MPENLETRLTRLEERQRSDREDLRVVFPLASQYAVLEEKHGNLRDHLNKGFDSVRDEVKDRRAEFKELKGELASRGKERRGYLAALAVCAVGLFGNFVAQLMAPDPVHPPAKEQTK